MKQTAIEKNGTVILPQVEIADNFFTRFRGLMFRKSIPEGYGLLIKPCNQIHMFNMKFPLDIIYLSKENEVVHIDENIQPGKVGKTVKKAVCVVEVNAFTCSKAGIVTGDKLTVL